MKPLITSWYLVYGYVVLFTCAVSYALIPICRKIAYKTSIVDSPGFRKLHENPVPLLGGLAIAIAFILGTFGHVLSVPVILQKIGMSSFFDDYFRFYIKAAPAVEFPFAVIILGFVAMNLVGILDDKLDLKPITRLIFQTAVAVLVVALGIKPDFFGFPTWFVSIVAVIWIVGITNSFNLLDGLDGLSSGVGIITSLNLALCMYAARQPILALMLVAFAGSILGFWLHNFPRASIYLGSSGSTSIGFLMAASMLHGTFNTHYHEGELNLLPIILPVLILAVPLYDTFSVIIIRIYKKKHIFKGDTNHLHHRLLKLGFKKYQVVLFVYMLTACFGLNAVLLINMSVRKSLIILMQVLFIFAILIILEYKSAKRSRETTDSDQSTE